MICIAIPIIFVVALGGLNPKFWKLVLGTKEMTVNWRVINEAKQVSVGLDNVGYGTLEIVRVEVIYLPDETLGLIWIKEISLERYTMTSVVSNLEEPEQLDFFNLLLEGANKVRIEVETKTKIWTFYPQEFGEYIKPDSVETK